MPFRARRPSGPWGRESAILRPVSTESPTWTPPPKPSFNSPAADLNQLRNETKRVAETAPGLAVHRAVLDRARSLAASLNHDLGLPASPDGLCYADLAVLLSQSR
jgi:hypothetical protein